MWNILSPIVTLKYFTKAQYGTAKLLTSSCFTCEDFSMFLSFSNCTISSLLDLSWCFHPSTIPARFCKIIAEIYVAMVTGLLSSHLSKVTETQLCSVFVTMTQTMERLCYANLCRHCTKILIFVFSTYFHDTHWYHFSCD